jgi:hypothetical protein
MAGRSSTHDPKQKFMKRVPPSFLKEARTSMALDRAEVIYPLSKFFSKEV